ncbi:MAG TPA: glycosyltransferase [Acidobacteriaceae bacterium]|nr:glycosyltransferase [Acidobacteriaceae bacterium]
MKPTIELSMIVKNGGEALRRCLGSARPFVDRICVGDTGSTNETGEIARQFDAEVVDIPWEQDSAQARNRVLERATCDWLLVLNADEMLDAWSGRRIRELVQGRILPEVGAFENWRWNYVGDLNVRLGERLARRNPGLLDAARDWPAYVLTPATRLFRRYPGLYYEGRVHETILGRLKALQLSLPTADFVVHHFGYAEHPQGERQGKNQGFRRWGRKVSPIRSRKTGKPTPVVFSSWVLANWSVLASRRQPSDTSRRPAGRIAGTRLPGSLRASASFGWGGSKTRGNG